MTTFSINPEPTEVVYNATTVQDCHPHVLVQNDDTHDETERFLVLCKDFGGRWGNYIPILRIWLNLACSLNRTLIVRKYSQWYGNKDTLGIPPADKDMDLGIRLDFDLLTKQLQECVSSTSRTADTKGKPCAEILLNSRLKG